MSDKTAELVNILKSRRVPTFLPGDLAYERSVVNPNLLYRFARPDCVVQPESASHVQRIVREAKKRNIKLVIKNGGHSYAGFSTAERGSISLDLSRMNDVEIDDEVKIVTVQGGAVWAHAYRQLVNGRHDGYIINGGRCPSVGVSGFILGGGLSPFTRSYGMGCDTLKEVTIVTADGELVTVKNTDDPKSKEGRLFWALCGAGGGNFGVVVELKLAIQELRNNGKLVVAGRYTWAPKKDDMDEFIKAMNDFYAVQWPNNMTIDSSWLCDLSKTGTELEVRFPFYFDGSKDDFDKEINKSINHPELKKQLKRRSVEEKSTRFLHETLVAQWSEETQKALPSQASYRIYTSFIFKTNSDFPKIIEIIRNEMASFKKEFVGEQGLLQVTFIHAGGKASEKKRSATAFRWRDALYHAYIMLEWNDKWLERDMRGFCQKMKEKLKPFSMMKRAAFINFPDGTLTQSMHERVYYGNNRQELQRLKQIWDSENFFSWAQGVQLPPGVTPRAAQPDAVAMAIRSIAAPEEDEAISGEETAVDEQALTDTIAKDQWENYNPPLANDIFGTQGLPFTGF
ncbi:hypothetical protein BDV23DRAFT_169024 [Aspergillus alliaceus]|uniref:Uncharacterized protein n=1 Tax=Petromyces alliaceus TaxID=209559 RepID=A0A5N6FJV9_PETAA|nr:uncharacterized protein BDW43DRAFT_321765 [Aspergillus alliaceus]KAB8229897.1 hypothetical protein BDW43DRAFT_321765 [Aspergillus alliaceus]KAE8394990.1 hypothetical protein BDV23DRAFT_169024 [Aspergillus alliaceus]